MTDLPVVVVGAGPIGLAAASELRERGLTPLVFERGSSAGSAVAQWNHVRLFSQWSELVDPAARRLLEETGWTAPEAETFPTGRQWASAYLVPLAAALGDVVKLNTEVLGVARRGRDRVVDAGCDGEPLSVHIRRADGSEDRVLASAVIDATGTWGSPNPLGGEGLPALGEHAAVAQIEYRVPDLDDAKVRADHAGKHTVVAGAGHSALTAIVALSALAAEAPGTRITWAVRRGDVGSTFGGGEADQLPARGALGLRAKKAVDDGVLQVVTGFRTATVESNGAGPVAMVADGGQRIEDVDRVVALTGFRPDLSWLSEIRRGLDPVLQAPVELAPLIDPNVHSCGTVYPHGVRELSHPEPDVYLVGMKSYGRAPTFLAMTGYEQVRSIAAHLAGDEEAAHRVELPLPETGVCGGAGVFDEPDTAAAEGGCCAAPESELVTLAPVTGQ
ncbi:pyridine nucleotide-disulfide oxidoreductase [Rhodococcus sp. OK611]|uniref:NAD(P)-binding domain-containing protein n=1 Tax=unclassified Rhodococcus (in: high G+C Gram-positive bacteria) TaxID=192944 RepID=UPI000BD0A85E|nr:MULTISPECIES: NAD(P)-binding domain-containing protein [unclassified Rhodococcus (in: high G+C Gram-positive bacteria)]PTR38980.1 pyridine nucleotide-disulfide oxidoreductase [Rhodococcus sp. OK611]SNX92766.1 Pyridine nucleotide-disulphide oxidoreductase [Rhodococcus sp. OK270]